MCRGLNRITSSTQSKTAAVPSPSEDCMTYKKILFYGFQFPHHGQHASYLALSRRLRSVNSNVEVEIVSGFYPRLPEKLPFLGQYLIKSLLMFSEQRLWTKAHNVHSVHYFYPENSCFKPRSSVGDPNLIFTCHQPTPIFHSMRSSGNFKQYFSSLQYANYVHLMSPFDKDAYQEAAPNAEISYMPHGVDSDFFAPSFAPRAHDGIFRILTVGNWLRDYRLWQRVADELSSKYKNLEFTVIANAQTVKMIRSGKLPKGCGLKFLSGITDINLLKEYQNADVVFLPLRDAWANNALLEGLSCGCEIVVSDLPATRLYGGDGVKYFQNGDITGATEAIASILQDHEERERSSDFSSNACVNRARAVDNYSWDSIARRHIDFYAGL